MTTSAEGRPGAGTRAGQDMAGLAAEVGRLRAEITRRHLLDLATGVLAAQLSASPADAAEHLDSLSHATGLGIEDLAADIVNAVAGRPAAETGETVGPGSATGRAHTGLLADSLGPDPAVAAPSVTGLSVPHATDARPVADTAAARRARRAAAAAETKDTVGEAARALLDGGLAPLGAESLWLWRRDAGGCLCLAGHAGVTAAEAAAWQWIPPAAPPAFHSVLSEGSPVWLDTGPADGEVLPGPAPHSARALLPVRRRGAVVGLALVTWPGPLTFEAPLMRALVGLTEVAGTVLDAADSPPATTPALVDVLDSLAHPAMLLRLAPSTSAPTVEHLNEYAVAALGGASFPEERSLPLALPHVHADLAHLARRARRSARAQRVPRLPLSTAPGQQDPPPLLDVRVLPAGAEGVVVLWHTVTDPGLASERAVARIQSVGLFQDSLTGGDTVWSEQAYGIFGRGRDEPPVPLLGLRGLVHPDDGAALTELLRTLTERRTGAQTVLRIVLGDRRTVRHVRVAAEPLLDGGTITGIAGVYQDVSESRRTEAALTATFDQLTAVRTRAELRHQVALQLQQAIVPEVPDVQQLPGLVAAARYRPAAEEYRVGGDWYDVQPLPSGKVLVAVGDVAGHGIDSVTGMVALRNAQRGLACTGDSPRRLMEWLNEATLRTSGHPTATAVCALYDPEDRSLVWSSAGHLPLLLLRDGVARLIEPPQDILLGAVPSYAYQERRTELRPGDTLLLYTDGLVERRHDGLDQGLAQLSAAAERVSGYPPDEQVDLLLGAATGDTDDDTSIVAVQVR
ncbi:SpoIIE family protein phosphatase [Streptomyces lateritius]|uniref:SpoIIE family protein phosphatase n=1 Tax=Streptomyces lateritius TaxID=67313 RepID=UPI0019C8C561|nr:SpoIIE family protein phosphatase [Streptomyces lateritius]GGT78985.1 transcription antitermination regulator [Streptomyces lateritius]